MNIINPYILLIIGIVFALLYTVIIIFGWARTRRARRTIQKSEVITLPLYSLSRMAPIAGATAECISLTNNRFLDTEGNPIDPTRYDAYIAADTSSSYSAIRPGNLLLFQKGTAILSHAIPVPSLSELK